MNTVKAFEYTNHKGTKHYLRHIVLDLRSAKAQKVYYFARSEEESKGIPSELPANKEVFENPRNGFVSVTRKKSRGEA